MPILRAIIQPHDLYKVVYIVFGFTGAGTYGLRGMTRLTPF